MASAIPVLEEQPSCSLHVVSLDDNPFYEALSYVWGDPTITAPIQLRASPRRSSDGADQISALSSLSINEAHSIQWPVTTNLEAALRYLRHESEVKILWIDAICIDQSNIEERNHQVPLMKSIYSNAENARVWLGSPAPRSDDAIAILKQFGQGIRIEKIKLRGHLIGDDNLEPVIELMERPWWTRTWVRQELILAKRAYLHCGLDSLEWFEPPTASQVTDLALGGQRAAIRSNRFTTKTLDRFIERLDCLLQFEAILERYLKQRSEPTEVDLAVLLGLGRFCTNSDDRDSIYGFLGLMNQDMARHIKPDYNMSVSEVFKDTATQLLTYSNSLIFQTLTGYTPKDDRLLPTWVPSCSAFGTTEDFEWRTKTQRLLFYNDFNACGNKATEFKVYYGNVLKLMGSQLDQVLSSGIGGVMAAQFNYSEVLEMQNEWRRYSCADVPEQSSYVAGGKAFDAFWRVLLSDLFPRDIHNVNSSWRQCQSKDDKAYRELLRVLATDNKPSIWTNDLAKAYYRGFSRTCFNRRFFITKKGYFGMGPAELAEGDQVYIVAGGQVPLILRPLSEAPRNTFELVGDCYVHGVMDGEAVTEPPQMTGNSSWKKALAAGKSIIRPSSKSLDPDLPLRDFHDVFIV